jgi:hypothetical protein
MAISLSCLVEGLDEEAADVENRAENREKARREAMVYSKAAKYVERMGDETIGGTMGWLSHVTVDRSCNLCINIVREQLDALGKTDNTGDCAALN